MATPRKPKPASAVKPAVPAAPPPRPTLPPAPGTVPELLAALCDFTWRLGSGQSARHPAETGEPTDSDAAAGCVIARDDALIAAYEAIERIALSVAKPPVT